MEIWRRHPDLNRGIKVLQTSALPLGYVARLRFKPLALLLALRGNVCFVCSVYSLCKQNWLGRQDSNLRMTESESVALPLGDAPIITAAATVCLPRQKVNLGWVVGLEPTHAWTTTMCLNHLTIPTAQLSLHIFRSYQPPGSLAYCGACFATCLIRLRLL